MQSSYVTLLQGIKKAKRNEKIRLLVGFLQDEDWKVFGKILYYAYTPTIKFYIKDLPFIGLGKYTLKDTLSTWTDLLIKSSARTITGHAQRTEFRCFMQSLRPEEADVFRRLVNKNLDVGIAGKTINEAYPGFLSLLEFMKAETYDKSRLVPGSYMSLKIDCIRGLLRAGVIYTTGKNALYGVQHITKGLPSNIDLDGELVIPDKPFNEASGLLRSHKDNPDAVFMVFDTPSIPEPFIERYRRLEEMARTWPANVQLIKHLPIKNHAHVDANFAKALDAGYEGLVIKSPSHKYQLKRSWDWMKLKAEDPDEVTIVGFNEGTGANKGSLGSVITERKNGVRVDVSGFKRDVADHIWANKDLWLGEIIEINFHEETPDGSLRHPRFAPIRDAKIHRHRWDKSNKPLASWSKI